MELLEGWDALGTEYVTTYVMSRWIRNKRTKMAHCRYAGVSVVMFSEDVVYLYFASAEKTKKALMIEVQELNMMGHDRSFVEMFK